MKKFFLAILAIFFLVEEWLWEKLKALANRVMEFPEFKRFHTWYREYAKTISPLGALCIFFAPTIFFFCLKLLAIIMSFKNPASGLMTLVVLKVLGFATTSFLFQEIKPKLMQILWFKWSYDIIVSVLNWAHSIVDPIKKKLKSMVSPV